MDALQVAPRSIPKLGFYLWAHILCFLLPVDNTLRLALVCKQFAEILLTVLPRKGRLPVDFTSTEYLRYAKYMPLIVFERALIIDTRQLFHQIIKEKIVLDNIVVFTTLGIIDADLVAKFQNLCILEGLINECLSDLIKVCRLPKLQRVGLTMTRTQHKVCSCFVQLPTAVLCPNLQELTIWKDPYQFERENVASPALMTFLDFLMMSGTRDLTRLHCDHSNLRQRINTTYSHLLTHKKITCIDITKPIVPPGATTLHTTDFNIYIERYHSDLTHSHPPPVPINWPTEFPNLENLDVFVHENTGLYDCDNARLNMPDFVRFILPKLTSIISNYYFPEIFQSVLDPSTMWINLRVFNYCAPATTFAFEDEIVPYSMLPLILNKCPLLEELSLSPLDFNRNDFPLLCPEAQDADQPLLEHANLKRLYVTDHETRDQALPFELLFLRSLRFPHLKCLKTRFLSAELLPPSNIQANEWCSTLNNIRRIICQLVDRSPALSILRISTLFRFDDALFPMSNEEERVHHPELEAFFEDLCKYCADKGVMDYRFVIDSDNTSETGFGTDYEFHEFRKSFIKPIHRPNNDEAIPIQRLQEDLQLIYDDNIYDITRCPKH